MEEEYKSLPIVRRWQSRIGYPRTLVSALENILEDSQYQLKPPEGDKTRLERHKGIFEGTTAEFEGSILARRDFPQRSAGQAWIGVLLMLFGVVAFIVLYSVDVRALGILLGPVFGAVGLVQLLTSRRTLKRLVLITFEGESYQAGAEQVKDAERTTVERTGVTSDVRLTLRAGVGMEEGDWHIKETFSDKSAADVKQFEQDVETIIETINEALPKLELPQVT